MYLIPLCAHLCIKERINYVDKNYFFFLYFFFSGPKDVYTYTSDDFLCKVFMLSH